MPHVTKKKLMIVSRTPAAVCTRLPIGKLAREWQVAPQTIRRWIAEGRILPRSLKRLTEKKILIDQESAETDLQDFLDSVRPEKSVAQS